MESFESGNPTPDINKRILDSLSITGIVIDTFCTMFLFNEFRYPKSPLRSSYFIMLTIGFVVTIITLLARIFFMSNHMSSEANWESAILSIIQWFSQNTLGIWLFYLGLNRCTAITSPVIHAKVSYDLLLKKKNGITLKS